jgi:beta-lactamase class A
MTALSIQSTTEPVHVFAHPAPVTLTNSATMSNGANRGERGKRMASVKPKFPSPLYRFRTNQPRNRCICGYHCGKPGTMRVEVAALWFRCANRPLQDPKREVSLPFDLPYRRVAILAGLSVLAACVPAGRQPVSPASVPITVHTTMPARTPPKPVQTRAQPSADLLNAVQALGTSFKGEVGISVRDIDEGWVVAWEGDRPRPQQSVSKFWVAIAVMDAVDQGRLSLSDSVTVTRSDLTLFHQPIRALVGKDGYRTTIGELLRGAMTRSDNTCNDVLLWRVGGPAAINRMLSDKGIVGVKFGPGERQLQARTAGLEWRPEWAGGWGFLQARAAMTYEARAKALRRYLANPLDGASTNGVTLGLSLLAQGKLLSPRSTSSLLTLMRSSKTGPLRLKSGLRPGWTLAHKTGTGQDLGNLSTGYNDVGLLVAPDGHRYVVAVMIASTRQAIPVRMRLMGDVTRAVVAAAGR